MKSTKPLGSGKSSLTVAAFFLVACLLISQLQHTLIPTTIKSYYYESSNSPIVPQYTAITQQQQAEVVVSPACKPHFQLTTPLISRTNTSKFKRLYFYHVRKAGGTSLSTYFKGVAKHHGLQYVHNEYDMAEEPGTNSEPTLYVTHLRDPVSVIVLCLCYVRIFALRLNT